MSTLRLGPDDDGGRFPIAVGSTVLLELPANPTTGFRWEIERLDIDVVEDLGGEFIMDSPPAVGSGGMYHHSFRVLAAGETVVALRYVQPWDSGTPAARFGVTLEISD